MRRVVVRERTLLMQDVTPFRDQGCKYCRAFWISHSDQPKLIGMSLGYQCHLYRCGVCQSWWEYGLNHPHAVDRELADAIAADIAQSSS